MRADVTAWLEASRADEQATDTLDASGNYSLAVFHAQQTAEKRLKAVCVRLHRTVHTHSLLQLLDEIGRLSHPAPEEVRAAARRLEAHYTAARYPNGFGPSPGPLYDAELMKEARQWMCTIVRFADSLL